VNQEVELSWEILDPRSNMAAHGSPTRTKRVAGGRIRRSRCCSGPAGMAAAMIVDLEATTTNVVNKKLDGLREEGGAFTMAGC